jgi:glycosyltransferase involved in cell wall biosynthesis
VTLDSAKISVLIPVYNCERYLGEAIASALSQTMPPIEVLVIDDGSTDGTARVAQSFGAHIRYVYQPNAGASAARNRGADLATGAFLSFLDADDLWHREKLSRQWTCFAEESELEIVACYLEHFVSPDVADRLTGRIRCPEHPMPAPGPATMLIRRQALLAVGPFDTAIRCGESIEWYARAVDLKLRCRMIPDVLVSRRLHLDNGSRMTPEGNADYLRVVREALERRRSAT